jgi:hypothetical protein
MLNVDPLPGLTIEQISLSQMKGFITKQDAVINLNLKPFMDRAIKEKPDFLNIDKDQQLDILKKYADEIITINKPQLDESAIFGDQDRGPGNFGQ